MKIIFARTRHVYASYIDFWRLVEASKFETRFVDEIDLADEWACYIFTPMNGEVLPVLEAQPKKRARVIWWHLERPAQDPTTFKSLDQLRGLVHAVWVSDKLCAKADSRFTYRFMASDADIATRSSEKLYDVCHLSYLWGRRKECIHAIQQRGISIAPQAFDRIGQDEVVAHSHMMLNLHQYEDAAFVAPLRFAVAAAYRVPIISELLAEPDQPGPHWQASIKAIPQLVEDFLQGKNYTRTMPIEIYGMLVHHKFCIETNFRNEVEKGVRELCGVASGHSR